MSARKACPVPVITVTHDTPEGRGATASRCPNRPLRGKPYCAEHRLAYEAVPLADVPRP